MASDQAQRLVEVSLNKIQSARGRRTGLNLHRSLLVSSVLFKAKTAIILAKYNMRCDFESYVSEPEEEEEEDEFEETQDSHEQQQQQIEDDAQIVPDVDYCPELQDAEQDIQEFEDNKENSPPQVSELDEEKKSGTTESDTNSKCNRCLKRRLTEVESAVESITKKQCTDEDNIENNNTQSPCNQESMDCAPINTLVDSFSCGFSGLLCVRQGYNGQNERSDAHNQDSHVQGLSDAFSTCSTHIKDSFETLSAPIMLSV